MHHPFDRQIRLRWKVKNKEDNNKAFNICDYRVIKYNSNIYFFKKINM